MDKGAATISPEIFQKNMQLQALAAFSAANSVSPMQYEINAGQVQGILNSQGNQLPTITQDALIKARNSMIQSTVKE